MTLRIYGAGMAGLLAANMLRRYSPIIEEAQQELPDNHGALLRFRSDLVQRATGIHLKKVHVLKAVSDNKSEDYLKTTSTLEHANRYSLKVTGRVTTRSVLRLEPVDRYIAPDDFLKELAAGATIHYGNRLERMSQLGGPQFPSISTIPMPALMNVVEWPDRPEFGWQPVWSVTCDIEDPEVDVYQTIYYPYPNDPYYRASITGNQLIIEYARVEPVMGMIKNHVTSVLTDFGLEGCDRSDIELKHQKYGKLMTIDENARRRFIVYMSDTWGVYSLGRFATWRQILLDDVVQDIHQIESFLRDRSGYVRARMFGGRDG